MTKEQFLKLNKEIGQLPPNPTIQKEFMENRFKDLGFSKESGYEAVQYYYSELYKAKENRQTIFEGKVLLSDNHFGIVDNTSTCYFKMTYERFNKRKELYFPSIPLPELILEANRDIDFTQTDPEYFANKLTELNSAYKENFVVTKEYIEQNPELGKINVGDINSKYPDWPKDPKLALELFKNFYAYKFFLMQVSKFLENIGSWNQKAIKDELNIYNQFIEKADKFNLMEAAEQRANLRNQYQWYVLLANDYFLTHSIQKDWGYSLDILYAKYFLFKNLLLKKSIMNQPQTKINTIINPSKPTLDEDIQEVKKIVFPLSGYWKRERIMKKSEFERLIDYIENIIKFDKLPNKVQMFSPTNVSNEFIRKTIYNVYRHLGKKNRDEFKDLIHLFQQFQNTEKSTTESKFSNYSGNYEVDIKNMITY